MGGGAPGRAALPVTQAENYVGLACSLLRRASWWEGFLSPALRGKRVLQPRELLSEIRRSQHCRGQERVPEPSRESQPRLGAVQRGHNPGTGDRHPGLEPPSQFETAEGAPRLLCASVRPPTSRPLRCLRPHARPVAGGPGGLALDSCRSSSWESACGSSSCLPGCSHGSRRKAEGSERPQEGLEGAATSFTVCTWERGRPPSSPGAGRTRAPGPGWGAVHRKPSCPGAGDSFGNQVS